LHVRTTLSFGALVLLLLGATALASYRWAHTTELAALQAQLRALAVSLAAGIDPQLPAASLAEGRRGSPSHRALVDRFAATGEDERDVSSIYVVVRTERRGFVRFAADWVRRGEPAEVGELYDAREMAEMRAAFRAPAVEQEIKVDDWGPSLSSYAPIRDREGRVVGVIGVDVSADRVASIDQQLLVATVIVYGIALLVILLAGVLLGRRIRAPIDRIVDAALAVSKGDLRARVNLRRDDELGLLGRHFDRMAIGLAERERLRAIFGRYVSEDVAKRVMSGPDAQRLGGELREVTVLFIDLHRFSTISETLPPVTVVAMLEQYLEAMTALVDRHSGCVIEMLGDALLVAFGAPSDVADHPAWAVRCGVAMQAKIEELNAQWEESGVANGWKSHGIERIRARIGVHVGRVVAGNTGGRTRMKYAVIGDTVNVAARIEALNEKLDTTMLVSGEVYARLPEELAQLADPRGEHAVKGRKQPVSVFAY
jgi:adenylate cyclase